MEALLDSLNEPQRAAATCIDHHVRVVAGAGSGKTRVLMARIEYLINVLGVFPSRIMAITFTNKATAEMRSRLEHQLGEMDASRVRISTIHSLCVRILREDAVAAGFPRNFEILDTDDQKSLLRKIYKENGISPKEMPFGSALDAISFLRMQDMANRLPEFRGEILDTHHMTLSEDQRNVAREYFSRLGQMRVMDFDDLLLQAHKLLKENGTVREKWQNRLDYIHVDEFQDVDLIQYDIVRLLTRKDAILTVVGDPDQTIYSWRGASVNIIMNFEKDFPDSKTFILDENYRSIQPILEASNAVIAHNQNRIEKNLFTKKEGETLLEFSAAEDLELEANKVVVKLEKDKRKSKRRWEDYAILYRSNYLSRPFEKELRMRRIPYHIIGGVRFFERKEVKDMLAYMRLLTTPDPTDPEQLSLNLSLERVVNEPKRGIGPAMISALETEASNRGCNILSVMRDPQTLSSAHRKKAAAFVEILSSLQKEFDRLADHRQYHQIIDHILNKTGYLQMLRASGQEGMIRLENIQELQNDIEQAMLYNPEMSIEEYLQNISLFTDSNKQASGTGVTLMTVHAAKGTEAPVVFLVGLSEGVFPSNRSLETGGKAALEEERRLMYVAMTRAQEKLYISWNRGYSYQLGKSLDASRFTLEIPDQWVKHTTKKTPAGSSVQGDGSNVASRFDKEDLVLKSASGKELGVIKGGKSTSRLQTLNSRRVSHASLRSRIKAGDQVTHAKFGTGIVLEAGPSALSIDFGPPYGIRRIAPSYVRKMEKE